MMLSLHPDYMLTHTLWPIAPDRTINVCEWHFQPSELARPGFDPVRLRRVLGHDEQAGLVRLRAVAGRHRAHRRTCPGPYSNREDLLYAFDRFIVEFHSQH